MVQLRIKPYRQQQAERENRLRQLALFRRNQILGLVLVAACICLWWIVHTKPGWASATGW